MTEHETAVKLNFVIVKEIKAAVAKSRRKTSSKKRRGKIG